MIVAYKTMCYFAATLFVVLGGMLFWPGNAIPWLCYALLLLVVEVFVLGLVLPSRRGPGSGAFDTIGGHAAMVVATAAFCWPSWQYATLSVATILAAQFMPGPRSQAFVFGAACSASALATVYAPAPSHAWVYDCVCWGVAVVLAGAAGICGTRGTRST